MFIRISTIAFVLPLLLSACGGGSSAGGDRDSALLNDEMSFSSYAAATSSMAKIDPMSGKQAQASADLASSTSSSTPNSSKSSTSSSSTSSNPPQDLKLVISALEANKKKWEARGIKSYQYESRYSCLCLYPILTEEKQVTVHEGVVTEAFVLSSSEYLTAEQLESIHTVDELFTVIRQAINEGYAEITVVYNAEYGYPESIFTDRRKDTIDDEVTYYMKDLM